jgi:hypothetical protein
MTDPRDHDIHLTIDRLAREEEELFSQASDGGGLSAAERERLHQIALELEQCYDLLQQRGARRAAGLDPDGAELRPPEIVERYQQ